MESADANKTQWTLVFVWYEIKKNYYGIFKDTNTQYIWKRSIYKKLDEKETGFRVDIPSETSFGNRWSLNMELPIQ